MKKFLLLYLILILISITKINAQCGDSITTVKISSIGIVLYSNDPETIWNALRLANYSSNQGDNVSIFLLGKGVELSTINSSDFDIKGQTDDFIMKGGTILACGTCLQSRKELLISITSAGIINPPKNNSRFILIESSLRDEGTSYHYLPPDKDSVIHEDLYNNVSRLFTNKELSLEPV